MIQRLVELARRIEIRRNRWWLWALAWLLLVIAILQVRNVLAG